MWGEKVSILGCNNYASFPSYAPNNGSSLTFYIIGTEESYEWWKRAKEKGTYKEEKEKVAQCVIREMVRVMPEVEGKIEAIDVATPLTYERYCGVWKGSWMSIMLKNRAPLQYPAKSSDYENLYFAGERMMEPGGLPVALVSGRTAVQWLCRDDETVFQALKE